MANIKAYLLRNGWTATSELHEDLSITLDDDDTRIITLDYSRWLDGETISSQTGADSNTTTTATVTITGNDTEKEIIITTSGGNKRSDTIRVNRKFVRTKDYGCC